MSSKLRPKVGTSNAEVLDEPIPTGRGAGVVRRVLEATREELAGVGYRALRVEDVAARAKVHKTTIYRRWPTKRDLVHDAMVDLVDPLAELSDMGSFRADLLTLVREMSRFMASIEGQSVIRMLMAESSDPDVASISESLRTRKDGPIRDMFARAIARGELRPNVDPELMKCVLMGAVHNRLFILIQPLDDLFLTRLVDLVLEGVAPRERTHSSRAR
jgi:AcrR family transcriptional regulator